MAIKNALLDVKNAVLIAKAGIQGTLKSLKETQAQAKKLTARKSIPKKKVHEEGMAKPIAKRKQKEPARNPADLVIKARAVVPRKPSKQKPARTTK